MTRFTGHGLASTACEEPACSKKYPLPGVSACAYPAALPTLQRRRAEGEDWITVAGPGSDNHLLLQALPLRLLNGGAAALEAALKRRLFPLELQLLPRRTAGGPLAVYDASQGRVLIAPSLLAGMLRNSDTDPVDGRLGTRAAGAVQQGHDKDANAAPLGEQAAQWRTLLERAASGLFDRLHAAVVQKQQVKGQQPQLKERGTPVDAAAAALVAPAAAAAIAAAFSPPLWFCILCPTVLGLAAPLLINLALNEAATLICQRLHMDDDECLDLW